VLSEDAAAAFRFAPLDSDAFRAAVDPARAARAGDTIIILDTSGEPLTRSAAVLFAARRLGGLWGALARVAALVPRPIADGVYDGVARVRHRLFARPADACPLLPPNLRDRFVH